MQLDLASDLGRQAGGIGGELRYAGRLTHLIILSPIGILTVVRLADVERACAIVGDQDRRHLSPSIGERPASCHRGLLKTDISLMEDSWSSAEDPHYHSGGPISCLHLLVGAEHGAIFHVD
jgi:hypothetical protein